MDPTSQPPKRRNHALSALTAAIESLSITKEASSSTPAKTVFGSASVLLTTIRDSKANKTDYAELGLACANVCVALDRGMNGRQADSRLSPSILEAIEQLMTAVSAIQRNVQRLGERSRHTLTKNDKKAIAAWKLDLNQILHVFNTELAVDTHLVAVDAHLVAVDAHLVAVDAHLVAVDAHLVAVDTRTMVSDIHRTLVERQEESDGGNHFTRTSTSREPPPPPPRACFGREDLINRIIALAESLTPVALIGPGGIGKTSVALSVLHNDRIKNRFGDNRRFIRCDQFPPSRAHFLARLSKVIGAGVENPEDLTPLRTSLSSEDMMIIIDNAEPILDPQGTDGQAIYRVVEELSQFNNICVVITSRITTVPPTCETIDVPTLSTGAAHNAFYNIYKYGDRSDGVNEILRRLDFHPLSVTLLATAAHQNRWDSNRLVKEWEKRQTGVLQTAHQTSLASTIELSMASLMFKDLGPDARELLGVIAFYPQGVNESNVEWLFPTISDVIHLLDAFCVLSLTYRANGFITMLAPLRDYLRPTDPKSSALLCTTKDRYFTRMSVELRPDRPGFNNSEWIVSEDVNVEHLLDVLTTINPDSDGVWIALHNFLNHIRWHKPRRTTLGARVEALPDSHPDKPLCLGMLGMLSGAVGSSVDKRRLLGHALGLWRDWGDDRGVATTLMVLSESNLVLCRYEEGTSQAKEALEIYERLGDPVECARCLDYLSGVLCADGKLDAAEEAAIRGIQLLPENGQENLFYSLNHTLGEVYRSKREIEKAIHHFGTALRIASSFNSHIHLFLAHGSMAYLFLEEGEFDNAHAHAQQAKSHASNNPYYLGLSALLLADIRYGQHELEDATSQALHALEIFEKVGSPEEERCRTLLRDIENASNARSVSSSTSANPHHDPE